MQAGHAPINRGRRAGRRHVGYAIAAAAALVAALAGAAPAGAQMRLQFDNAKPGKFFWANGKPLRYRFEIAGQRDRDVRIEAVQAKTGKVRKAWRRNGVRAQKRVGVNWRGVLNKGNPTPGGNYRFRIREIDGEVATRARASKVRIASIRHNRFPMGGHVGWGDGWGAGRGHRGQDLFAPCGRPILAARAGRVVWRGFQGSGAGHYVVVRGRKDGFDYVYMHLRKNVLVREGDRVRTGERLGSNGQTGNASGCHLHFELWRGHWFGGGKALRAVTKHLRRWDRWS